MKTFKSPMDNPVIELTFTQVLKNQIIATQIRLETSQKILLDQFSLSLQAGQLSAITGDNGVGKSTLLNCLSGIVKPTAGTVFVGELNLHKLMPLERAKLISAIGQFETAADDLLVAERIAQGLCARNGFGKLMNEAIRTKIADIADELNLRHLLNRPVGTLSGGEKKRVHVARCLIDDEALAYLLDEPFAGLDRPSQEIVQEALKSRAEGGKVVALSSHEWHLLEGFADQIIALNNDFSLALSHGKTIFQPRLDVDAGLSGVRSGR